MDFLISRKCCLQKLKTSPKQAVPNYIMDFLYRFVGNELYITIFPKAFGLLATKNLWSGSALSKLRQQICPLWLIVCHLNWAQFKTGNNSHAWQTPASVDRGCLVEKDSFGCINTTQMTCNASLLSKI